MNHLTILLIILFIGNRATAQELPISLDESISIAIQNNRTVKSAKLNEQSKSYLQKTAYTIPQTQIDADYGQFNSVKNDTRFGISQTFAFPTVYSNQKKALKADFNKAKTEVQLTSQEIKTRVRNIYYDYLWLNSKKELLVYADSIYRIMEKKSDLRFKAGEANVLEKSASQSARQFYSNQLVMVNRDIEIALNSFNAILQDKVEHTPKKMNLKAILNRSSIENLKAENLPAVQRSQFESEAAKWRWKTEGAKMLPEITLGYNNLSIIGNQTDASGQDVYYGSGQRFSYVNAGLSIPIFFTSQSEKKRAAKAEYESYVELSEAAKIEVKTNIENADKELKKYQESLQYYETDGLKNAQTIIEASSSQLQNGDIDYLQWVLVVNQAITIKSEYLDALNAYNKAVVTLQNLNNI